jgi:hypothetical protein
VAREEADHRRAGLTGDQKVAAASALMRAVVAENYLAALRRWLVVR